MQNYNSRGSDDNPDDDFREIGNEGKNDDIMEEAQNRVNVKLSACSICGRKFAVDRLAKHTKACKIASKKRKAFDETLMRAGDDSEMIQKAKEAKKQLMLEQKQKEK